MLHAAFNFDLLESRWDARRFGRVIQDWEGALGAAKWPTQVLNNHDTMRSATRFGQGEDDQRLKVAAAMLLTLRGTPFMYYGEEIGMRDIRLMRSQILDPIGRHYWPVFKGRDGCRAPMQWDASANAGYSPIQPWLPVHPDYRARNVVAQSPQADSLLNTYKQLLALRRENAVLVKGDFALLTGIPRGVLAYRRAWQDASALLFLNFASNPVKIDLPSQNMNGRVLWSSRARAEIHPGESGVTLQPYEALILTMLAGGRSEV